MGRCAAHDTIEIRSPEDETYEKLPFYAALRVTEVVVLHRDSKEPEIFKLAGSQYVAIQRDREGCVAAETFDVRFLRLDGAPPKLRIEDLTDRSHSLEI